jgi:hypothetical protein
MAKKMKVEIEMKKGSKGKKEFTPCSRCPDPKSCTAAGRCLAQSLNG